MRLIALILSLFSPVLALADQAVDIDTLDGVTVRLAIVASSDPKGVAVLFTGGAGKLRIRKDGTIKKGSNFLVSTREMFKESGFIAIVPDTPSDRKKGDGLCGFRDISGYF